jgi:hypothetical protein
MEQQKVVIRVAGTNRNHHLYNNNGTWWIHYTVHRPDYTKVRVRQSLRTKCVDTARLERDRLFRRLNVAAEVPLAA